jgi:hypothetical protein
VRVREDKNIEDATRSTILAEQWKRGSSKSKTQTNVSGVDDADMVDVELLESEIEEDNNPDEG